MDITAARPEQYDAVRAFYHSLIDHRKDSPYDIGWKKDIYPAPEFLRDSLAAGELYIGCADDAIAAAMVLNHQCNEGYSRFHWQTEASPDEVTVIHALGVHPRYSGRGYGREMVQKALQIARCSGQKAVRLDVLGGNLPAERLYTGLGFQYMDTLKMFYEDTGWTDYMLYEYVL